MTLLSNQRHFDVRRKSLAMHANLFDGVMPRVTRTSPDLVRRRDPVSGAALGGCYTADA
jgi:hypothetical protein